MLVLELGRKDRIDYLAFSPDGRSLVASATTGLYIWRDFTDAQKAVQLLGGRYLGAARFTSDGKWLFTSRRQVSRIDAATGASETFKQWGNYGARLDLSPTQPLALISFSLGGNYRIRTGLWRTDDFSSTGLVWEHETEGFSFSRGHFFPDGEQFFRVEIRYDTTGQRNDFTFVRLGTTNGERIGRPIVLPFNIFEPLLSPDGSWLVQRDLNRIELFPLGPNTAGPAQIRNDNRKHFTDAVFHPSGKCIAATSNDRTVKLYDAATWQESRTFTWNIGRMRSLAFSPDGTLAACGSDKGQVVIWDVDL